MILTHLYLLEFPILTDWTLIYFEFKGCWVVTYNFFQILKVHFVSKQWGTRSDATLCDVWSGSALSADVP